MSRYFHEAPFRRNKIGSSNSKESTEQAGKYSVSVVHVDVLTCTDLYTHRKSQSGIKPSLQDAKQLEITLVYISLFAI